MIIPSLIDISAVFLKSLMENQFESMTKLALLSVHFQVIIVIPPPFSIPKREKTKINPLNCVVLSENILYVWHLH